MYPVAWCMGAGNSTSGIIALHEVVRGLGEPLRTIVIASWDTEEATAFFTHNYHSTVSSKALGRVGFRRVDPGACSVLHQ
ncbi:hypothetical protein DFH29DRAFT_907662, partial [Suillus ampliporus]